MLPEGVQSIQGGLLVHGGVDRLQIGHEGLQVLVGHIFAGIAQLVDDTILDLGFWENGMDGRVKPCQIVRAGDENILYARFRRPLSTVAQNLALSFSPTHMPSTSLRPSRSMPMAI